ncbi:killer toxin alpha/beta [Apodospora peruviana]|uniref:chitinase n=1 Tax=Apodospora peruviana TaxID=516989 RepID=A0AAE0MFR1_9PEZI|nr:killer toxin alpha/beta [Apodospora peruviana]
MRPVFKLEAAALGLLWASFALGSAAAADDDWVPRDSPRTFYSDLHPCPASCVGPPTNWTVYSAVDRISVCDEPLLLNFNVYNPLDDPATTVLLHACTTKDGNPKTQVNALVDNSTIPASRRRKRSVTASDLAKRAAPFPVCAPSKQSNSTLELIVTGTKAGPDDKKTPDVHGALEQVQNYMKEQENCEAKVIFGYSQGAVVGVYSGAAIDNAASAPAAIQKLIDSVKDEGALIQLCGEGRNAAQVFGAVVDPSGDLASVQKTVKSWAKGLCVNGTSPSPVKDVKIFETPVELSSGGNQTANGTTISARRLHARADCRIIRVQDGDGCESLAGRCGISPADFTKYNSDSKFCSSLVAGMPACCSSGTMPDIKPKQNSDGSCAAYTVQPNDFCSKIAATNGLKVAELEGFNNGTTWGWNGCGNLMLGINICLSKGTPPMPAEMSNAVCGPTKPGTKKPTGDTKLEDLNPCPLNACCNVWGQCGIDSDFCVKELGPSKNPGTSPPGKNGCVASCGTSVINNKEAPAAGFQKIGYYESWNWNRKCLNMRADQLDYIDDYTHMHWGFAEIGPDFTVSIPDEHKQFDGFKKLQINKIISFGGWGYSTEPATYDKLREAMQPANRGKFADNIVKFLQDNKLDGVDIDWEYPGAPDIPGVPPGKADDGANYLKFLTTLKGKLPTGMTLSIAAPASFWYLKQFPIDKMAKTLDYIVYMTYDLHGQWDFGSQWASPGCPTGNCLRSHVNLTETMLTLAMVTKAGVPSNKLFVGVSSYGRSFKMEKAGCDGPECTFVGPESGAQKGMCTDTSGYISNAEIGLLKTRKGVKEWTDTKSASQIMTWDGTEWVAYMTDDQKKARGTRYKGLNFAGTVDWAVDLQGFTGDDDRGPTDDDEEDDDDEDLPNMPPLPDCDDTYNNMDDVESKLDGAPQHCKAMYTLMGLRGLLKDSTDKYDSMVKKDYDHKFDVYAKAVVGSASGQITSFMYEHGNDYFSCDVTEIQFCCSFCESQWGKDECDYCHHDKCTKRKRDTDLVPATTTAPDPFLDNGLGLVARDRPPPGGNTVYVRTYTIVPEPCPPDYSKRGVHASGAIHEKDNYSNTVKWNLRKDREEAFWKDILKETGIDQKDIAFKDINKWGDCNGRHDNCKDEEWDLSFPQPNGYTKEDVSNPKEVAQKGLENTIDFVPQMEDAIDALAVDSYDADPYELVDAVALPIFMIADAVDQMAKVVEVADDIIEKERKAIIFAFLSAILFFIPIAGEILGTVAAMANIGRIIALLGELANVANDIATIVTDPDNAPLAIMSLLTGPLAIADAAKIGKAANIRRGMKGDDVVKLGGKIEGRMKTVAKCTSGKCKKRE